MTHTPRTLSLVAALLLALAACTDDLTQTPATPGGDLAGQPVQFSTTALSVTPAGILADKLLTLTLPTEGLQAGTSLTTTSATDVTLISCTTPSTLADVWPEDNPEKVLITGTLNGDDITTLNSHKNEITHLYVTANAENNTDWEDLDFYGSSSITEIYLAQATAITTTLAFSNCTSLRSVNLPKATNIGSGAFLYCTALANVSLPKATNIGIGAFCDCTSLINVNLPKVTDIGSSAFSGCTSLTNVSLPQATNIGFDAFLYCTALANVCLPTDVEFGSSPFIGCSKLTTLYLNCPEADFNEATHSTYGGFNWQHIYYGYRGTGDYLDPASYTGHWTAPTTNP